MRSPDPLRRLTLITLIDATGTGLFLGISALYLTRTGGFTIPQVATGLTIAGAAAFLAAIPLGAAGDRLGHRRLWVTLYSVHAGAFVAYPFIRDFPLLVTTMTVIALAEVGVSPARATFIAHLAGPDRVRVRATLQAVTNIGFVAGAAGATVTLKLDAGYTALLLANAASYLIGACIVLTLPETPRHQRSLRGTIDRRYLTFSALNGLLMCYLAILTVALPLWIANRTTAPPWTAPALMAVNTILVVLLQVRASRGAETTRGAARAIRRSGWARLAACLIFAASGGPAPAVILTAGMVVFTIAEIWHSAGAWGISYALAPPDQRGRYLGAFTMGTRIYDTAGPALVTALTLGAGPVGWVVLGVGFLLLAWSASACGVGGDVLPHGDQHGDDDEPREHETQHPETGVGEKPGHGTTSLDRAND